MVQEQIESSNNIVAKSEYEAALAAIDSTFDSFQIQEEEDRHRRPDLDHEMIKRIYEAGKKSLLRNVERIVRPLNDDEFSDYVDQYHIVLEEDEDSDDDQGKNKEQEEMALGEGPFPRIS